MLRVAFVLRSTEVHPVFFWFVPLYFQRNRARLFSWGSPAPVLLPVRMPLLPTTTSARSTGASTRWHQSARWSLLALLLITSTNAMAAGTNVDCCQHRLATKFLGLCRLVTTSTNATAAGTEVDKVNWCQHRWSPKLRASH